MTLQLSRRALIGASAAAPVIATMGTRALAAVAPAEPPVFGPAPGTALLSRNENPFGPAPSAIAAINAAASKGCYYADGGVRKLTEVIAERFGVTPDHVVLGSGSTEVLCAAALAFRSKGSILCPELFWDTTVLYAEHQGATAKRVPLGADMGIDLDAMAAAVGPDVGMVHICNPNNPTGMLLDPAKLKAFVAKVSPGTLVLVDEAYNELTNAPAEASVSSMVKDGANLIVCRTFSKIYGMAGLRVGYAITKPEYAALIRPYMMSFGGNTAGLAAAIASYNDTGFMASSKQAVVDARGILLDGVKKAGCTALPSQANFLYVKVPEAIGADAVQKAMAARGVEIRPAYGKWKQWSRVSCGKIEDVKRYAAALPEVIGA